MKTSDSFDGHGVLILSGEHAGEEGICLGQAAGADGWAVSPDSSAAVLELRFESDFALLLDLSAKRGNNQTGALIGKVVLLPRFASSLLCVQSLPR